MTKVFPQDIVAKKEYKHKGTMGFMDFYKRMSIVCTSIPHGKVATYGQIALLCGRPKNSRQVGFALRNNLAGEVPAHRIVNSRGLLSGARMFETPDTQKDLLEGEGVRVEKTDEGWRVNLRKYAWQNTMDDAEELRVVFDGLGI